MFAKRRKNEHQYGSDLAAQQPITEPELTTSEGEYITPIHVRTQHKPLSWMSASMVYGLAETVLGIVALVLVLIVSALAVLIGVGSHSVSLGIMVGAPFIIILWLWLIWVHPRVVRWGLSTLGYEMPGFWQTWAALAWGMLLFLFLSIVMLSPLTYLALGQGHSSSTAKISLVVFATLSLPILRTFAIGWALAEAFERSRRAAKAVSWIYILAQLLVVTTIGVGTGFALSYVKHASQSNKAAQARLLDSAGVAAVYYVNHGQSYGARVALARDLCRHSSPGDVKGSTADCNTLLPAKWNAAWTSSHVGRHIWLGKVSGQYAELCTSDGDAKDIYCLILRGEKTSLKGFSDRNLGQALQSAKDNLGF